MKTGSRCSSGRCRSRVPPTSSIPISAKVRVVSCYGAGRDGFWLHRFLVEQGIENRVVDSSSIEVNRRQRRVKTDRMDVVKLLGLLLRYEGGERKAWSVVRVPALEEEDARQLHRELLTTKRERTRVTNRIRGLLASQGLGIDLRADVPAQLEQMQLWDGSPLPPGAAGGNAPLPPSLPASPQSGSSATPDAIAHGSSRDHLR